MKKLILIILFLALAGQTYATEKEIPSIGDEAITYLYSIDYKGEVLWMVPTSEIESITKPEWKDIWLLVEIAMNSRSMTKETASSIIKTLSPKRFIVKE